MDTMPNSPRPIVPALGRKANRLLCVKGEAGRSARCTQCDPVFKTKMSMKVYIKCIIFSCYVFISLTLELLENKMLSNSAKANTCRG